MWELMLILPVGDWLRVLASGVPVGMLIWLGWVLRSMRDRREDREDAKLKLCRKCVLLKRWVDF